MISFINGKLAQKLPTALIIDVNGVGFAISANPRCISQAGAVGDEIKLHTQLCVTERDMSFNLYGFTTREERDLFARLVGISGVGAKSALALLGQMSVSDFTLMRFFSFRANPAISFKPSVS